MSPIGCARSAWLRHGAVWAAALAAQLHYGSAHAHPHVWVDYSVMIQGRGSVIHALQERWVFARSFPVAVMIDPSKLPESGPLDAQSTAVFKSQAFNSLKSVGYFTHVYAGGKPMKFGEPQHFAVSIEDGKMVYTFVLPLAEPVDMAGAAVELGIWDTSFFVNYQPEGPHAMTFAAGIAQGCGAQAYPDRDHPIFGGMVVPVAAKLTCAPSK